MPENGDKVKRLVAFKKRLETEIRELDAELKELQATLETVNSVLLEKGFKRVEITEKPTAPETGLPEGREEATGPQPVHAHSEAGREDSTTLKTATGEVLADVFFDGDSLHVLPAEDKSFNVNTPPFNQFLVQRVLLRMQQRDSELVKSGQLASDRILCFDIVREGETLNEIIIRNIDADRLRELKSSVRWTLEKMLEKTKG